MNIYKYMLSLVLVMAFVAVVDIVCDANSQIVKPVKYGDNFQATENIFIQNAKIGNNFECGSFCVIGGGTTEVYIGDNVTLGNFVEIKSGAKIGNNVIIHSRVTIGYYQIVDDSEEVVTTED